MTKRRQGELRNVREATRHANEESFDDEGDRTVLTTKECCNEPDKNASAKPHEKGQRKGAALQD